MNDIQTLQAQINTALRSVSTPLAIVLEGRDGAGKTGAIRQATEYLPFSQYRIIHKNYFILSRIRCQILRKINRMSVYLHQGHTILLISNMHF